MYIEEVYKHIHKSTRVCKVDTTQSKIIIKGSVAGIWHTYQEVHLMRTMKDLMYTIRYWYFDSIFVG